MKNSRSFWVGNAILLGSLLALLSAGQMWGLFERAEFAAGDALLNLRGKRAPSANIVIVAIDERSLTESGYRWPWPRDYIAKVVEQIGAGKPSALAIDILFVDPSDREGTDEALARALKSVRSVVLSGAVSHNDESSGFSVTWVELPVPILRDSIEGVGLINQPVDIDGIARQFWMGAKLDNIVYYSLPLETASLYLYQTPYGSAPARFNFSTKKEPAINFRGPAGTFPIVSAVSVANGEVPPETFAGKIVLLGVTDPALHDFLPTPFGGFKQPMPGVEILANEIDTLIAGDYIWRIGVNGEPLGLPLIFIITIAGYAVGYTRSLLKCLARLAVVGLGYTLIWAVAFLAFHLQMSWAVPIVGLMVGCVLTAFRPAWLFQWSENLLRTDRPISGSWLSLVGSGLVLLSFTGIQWSPYPDYADSPDNFSNILFNGTCGLLLVGALGVLTLTVWKMLLGPARPKLITPLLWFFSLAIICPILAALPFILVASVTGQDIVLTIISLSAIGGIAGSIWNFRRRPTQFSLWLLTIAFAFWPVMDITFSMGQSGIREFFRSEGWSFALAPLGISLIISGAIADSIPPRRPSPSQ